MSLNKISINDTTTVNTGIVYDISKANNGATYTDLTDALGINGINVPLEIREGGMSIRFVSNSDNKYVQYRLMSNSFNTTLANWQGVDDEPTAGSDNLVKSGGVYDSIIKATSESVEEDDGVSGYQLSQYNNGTAITTTSGNIRIYKNLGGKTVLIYGKTKTLSSNIAIIATATGGNYGSFINWNLVKYQVYAAEIDVKKEITLQDGQWLLLSTFDSFELNVYLSQSDYFGEQISGNKASILELKSKIISDNTPDYGIDNIVNGNKKVFAVINDFLSSDKLKITINELWNKFSYLRIGSGNTFIRTNYFTPTNSSLVYVKMRVSNFSTSGNAFGLVIIVSNSTDNLGKSANLGYITDNGDYGFTFDAANLSVYSGFTNFCIWINNVSFTEGSISCDISDFEVFEVNSQNIFNNISGNNSFELFESVDDKITDVATNTQLPIYTTPQGGKFIIYINDSGVLVSIPLYTSKAVFYGNSLLSGFSSYGMAASESGKDYYDLLSSYFQSKNASFVGSKIFGKPLEDITSSDNIESIVNQYVALCAEDAGLVVIQLGDNVDYVNNYTAYESWSKMLLMKLRQRCPNARVIWMGVWYPANERIEIAKKACKTTGCEFLDFSTLINVPGVRSYIGAVSHVGYGTRTISGVTSVTPGSDNNITISFTVSGNAYSATIPVSSYELNGTILTYTSEYLIVDNSGIASHPSDEGFRQISNLFLYKLGYEDETEYFE